MDFGMFSALNVASQVLAAAMSSSSVLCSGTAPARIEISLVFSVHSRSLQVIGLSNICFLDGERLVKPPDMTNSASVKMG